MACIFCLFVDFHRVPFALFERLMFCFVWFLIGGCVVFIRPREYTVIEFLMLVGPIGLLFLFICKVLQ